MDPQNQNAPNMTPEQQPVMPPQPAPAPAAPPQPEPITAPTPAPAPVPTPAPAPSPMAANPMPLAAASPTLGPPPMPAPGPAPAAFPQTAPMPAGGMMPSGGKSKKGLLIGIIGGVVGLLVVIIAAVLLITGMNVSKADYKKAEDTYNTTIDAYNEIGTVYVTESSSTTEIANAVEKLKTAKGNFDTSLDKLSKEKAVTNDNDVKALFKQVSGKRDKFNEAFGTSLEIYEKAYPVLAKLNGVNSSNAVSTLKSVLSELEGLSFTYDVNTQYISDTIKTARQLLSTLQQIQSSSSYNSSLYKQYYALADKLTNLDNAYQDKITKLSKDSDMEKELNAVGDKLYDKYSTSK